jgi:aspartate 1-decarboxylase
MQRLFITAKCHRAKVTGANLDYTGSIAVSEEIMDAMGLAPFEFVHVNNCANGAHWETYVIPGLPGEITLHGPPAHHFKAGDLVVINRLVSVELSEIAKVEHVCVFVDGENHVTRVDKKSMADMALRRWEER